MCISFFLSFFLFFISLTTQSCPYELEDTNPQVSEFGFEFIKISNRAIKQAAEGKISSRFSFRKNKKDHRSWNKKLLETEYLSTTKETKCSKGVYSSSEDVVVSVESSFIAHRPSSYFENEKISNEKFISLLFNGKFSKEKKENNLFLMNLSIVGKLESEVSFEKISAKGLDLSGGLRGVLTTKSHNSHLFQALIIKNDKYSSIFKKGTSICGFYSKSKRETLIECRQTFILRPCFFKESNYFLVYALKAAIKRELEVNFSQAIEKIELEIAPGT